MNLGVLCTVRLSKGYASVWLGSFQCWGLNKPGVSLGLVCLQAASGRK